MWNGILIIFCAHLSYTKMAPGIKRCHWIFYDRFGDVCRMFVSLFCSAGARSMMPCCAQDSMPVVDRSIVPINKFYVARLGWRGPRKIGLAFYSNFLVFNRRENIHFAIGAYFIGFFWCLILLESFWVDIFSLVIEKSLRFSLELFASSSFNLFTLNTFRDIATQKWERNLVDADERKEVDGDKGENRSMQIPRNLFTIAEI